MKVYVNPEKRDWAPLLKRAQMERTQIESRVSTILEKVRMGGDEALIELSKQIDSVSLDSVKVSEREIADSHGKVPQKLKDAIAVAAANIEAFHAAQKHPTVELETMPGVRCIQKSVPISKVGLYIPGGSAPLFSTVLMLALPARVAGCAEIILCTPPNREGSVAPEILYTADMCGVTRIFKVGGAQAIAAMAYGTFSVPGVDKIFGPGNQYVTEAKRQVSVAQVAIDMPAGPSEVMVMADESAQVAFVAADMLSQAEHGADSQAILVCSSRSFAKQVEIEVENQLKALNRSDIARIALDNSRIVVMDEVAEMIDFANEYAAEHLIISMENPWSIAEKITAAGSVFIGNFTPESAGDYASGTNHTLPTYGWARSTSGVNLDSFMRKITYQEITPAGLQNIGEVIQIMAQAEGLDAHKNAVTVRLKTL